MSPNNTRPWKILVPLAVVVLLAALWSAYWYMAQTTARGEFAKTRAKLVTKGIELACSSESWSGFPFRFKYRCQNATVMERGSKRLESTDLEAVALAYQPWHVITVLRGPSAVQNGKTRRFDITHDAVITSIVADSTQGGTATTEIPNLTVAGLLKAKSILLSGRTGDMRQIEYAATVEGLAITLPGAEPVAIDSAESKGIITEDRTLIINSTIIRQGALELHATGQLSLDEQHRPQGQLALKTNDGAKLLQATATALHLTEKEQTALSALLTVTGNQLMLTARNGQLFTGPLKIGDLAPLF